MIFSELIKRISPKLKGITYRLCRGYSFLNSDDLYQESLLHLWQDFNDGLLENKTDSYILQGCYFYLKNYLRNAKITRQMVSLSDICGAEQCDLEEVALLKDQRSEAYLEQLDNRMLAETIRNNGLTDREKYILSLCAEGLTTRQIGQQLTVSHVSVVKTMARIRQKCFKYLI